MEESVWRHPSVVRYEAALAGIISPRVSCSKAPGDAQRDLQLFSGDIGGKIARPAAAENVRVVRDSLSLR